MVSDLPLGAVLSGGMDSSLIVALMQAHSGRPVNTFTVAFQEKRYDESAYARAVAKHLGTDHCEVMVTSDDAIALVPELPYWFDEPLADPGIFEAWRPKLDKDVTLGHPLADSGHDGLPPGPP